MEQAFVYPAHRYRMLSDHDYAEAIKKLMSEGMTDEQAARALQAQEKPDAL